MSIIYQFGIAIYTIIIRIASLFNSKAAEWVRGRKSWKQKLAQSFKSGDKIAWFHAASLGEFEQGRPVMEAFREQYPQYKILLTFFSPSGYLQKKDYPGADAIMYLPPDCPGNAKYFIKTLNPALAIFIKYEFWYNYLAELTRQKVPAVFISALIKGNEPFFKWYGGWFRAILRRIDHFFVQDERSAENLKQIGINKVTISGDTRFDRVADILEDKSENRDIEKFCEGQKVLLAGSTWPSDEDVLREMLRNFPGMKLIIAPHEVKEDRVRQLISTLDVDVARFTKDNPASWNKKRVLVIDTIGVLSSIYRYADIAYIGGAFATGLHNIQEPAVNGMPVIFGPKYHKFKEAIDLVELGGAFSINSKVELASVLGELMENEQRYQQSSAICKKYMLDSRGATEKILEGLKQYLS